MKGMAFRTVLGSVLVLGIGLLLLLDWLLFRESRPLGSLLLAALALGGFWEYARLTGIRGEGPKAYPALWALGAGAVIYFFSVAWAFRASDTATPSGSAGEEWAWTSGGIFVLVVLAFTLVLCRSEFERYYLSLLETVMGALLLGLMFSYLLKVYHLPGWQGPVLGAVLVAGVKGNDTAAYYVGKMWGKTRLLKVSPRKTLEGSLGALFFSAAYFGAAGGIMEAAQPGSLFHWSGGILFGMIVSVVSQIGDLGESLIKRVYQVKDSGSLLPEFGGVLDMIDSLIFTGFLFWFWELR